MWTLDNQPPHNSRTKQQHAEMEVVLLSFKDPALTQIRVFSFVQSNDSNQGRSYFYQRLSALVIICTVYSLQVPNPVAELSSGQ